MASLPTTLAAAARVHTAQSEENIAFAGNRISAVAHVRQLVLAYILQGPAIVPDIATETKDGNESHTGKNDEELFVIVIKETTGGVLGLKKKEKVPTPLPEAIRLLLPQDAEILSVTIDPVNHLARVFYAVP